MKRMVQLGILVTAFACASITQAKDRPHLLYILADDMGWQDTSVPFGPERTLFNERYRTQALERLGRLFRWTPSGSHPNIDRLADRDAWKRAPTSIMIGSPCRRR